MLVLLADGGSTKCDWVAIDASNRNIVFRDQTKGMNPLLCTEKDILEILSTSELLSSYKDQIEKIYFYGAGCVASSQQDFLQQVFFSVFTRLNDNIVKSDLLGAAKAVASLGKESLVAILGTGSIACFYNGVDSVVPTVPSLGYLLMDEASGNYFGKCLLQDFFYQKMPSSLISKFQEQFGLSPIVIKKHLYQDNSQPVNVYLASFSKFLLQYVDSSQSLKLLLTLEEEKYVTQLCKSGIDLFVQRHLCSNLNSRDVQTKQVHFVGSVAFYLQPFLEEVLESYGFVLGNVVQRPIDGILKNYLEHLSVKSSKY